MRSVHEAGPVAADYEIRAVAGDLDTSKAVAGDYVGGAGGSSAHRVEHGVVEGNAVAAVAPGQHAGYVGADVVAFDHVVGGTVHLNAVAGEPVDHQTAHRAVAGSDGEAIRGGACQAAVQLYERSRKKTWLCRPVDNHRIGDCW